MVLFFTIINTILMVIILGQRDSKLSILREIKKAMATHEQQLQDALTILRDVVSPGVTEILNRLDAVPTDNPAVQDEIDGVKAVAQEMADRINAKLNPPAPEPTPEGEEPV